MNTMPVSIRSAMRLLREVSRVNIEQPSPKRESLASEIAASPELSGPNSVVVSNGSRRL